METPTEMTEQEQQNTVATLDDLTTRMA